MAITEVEITPGSGAKIAVVENGSGNLIQEMRDEAVKAQVEAMSAKFAVNKAIGSTGAAAEGGAETKYLVSAATTNSTLVKNSKGQVYGWSIYNKSAATVFVKLYNKATAPTIGTDTPVFTIPVPAGSSAVLASDVGIVF